LHGKFSDVEITGSVRHQSWTEEVIGTTMLSNDAEPMYVSVANSSGEPVVIYHDNPDATQIENWTEWIIPLQDLENQGLILTDVEKIAVGFGDKDNPKQNSGDGSM